MIERGDTFQADDDGEFDRGFEGVRRRQARAGLRLTPAQRLEWLDRTMKEMRRLQGCAGRM